MDSNKPLSIALAEIAAGKIVVQSAQDARRMAEELLSAELGGEAEQGGEPEAEVYPLETDGEDAEDNG